MNEKIFSALKLDAQLLTNGEKEQKAAYMKANSFTYEVLATTWGQLLSALSQEAGAYYWHSLPVRGLITMVDDAQKLASDLLRGEPLRAAEYGWLYPVAFSGLDEESGRKVLQALRYPKRLTVSAAPVLEKSTIATFKARNKTNRDIDRRGLPYWFIRGLREVIANHVLVRSEELVASISDADLVPLGHISSGATTGWDASILSDATPADRILACARKIGSFNSSLGEPWMPLLTWHCEKANDIVALAVPKSYKTYRIVCKENAGDQYFCHALSKMLDLHLRHEMVDYRNQARNRELCRLGSISGSFATVDCSAASDSITETLASALPTGWMNAFRRHKTDYMHVGDALVKRYIPFSSGNGATFLAESTIFCGISLFATETWLRFTTGQSTCHYDWENALVSCGGITCVLPRIIGDDIICDDKVAALVCEFLGIAGIEANEDKSYWGSQQLGFYRESCGAEYLNGFDLATRYFPRKVLTKSKEDKNETSLSSLISLQHRLWDNIECRLFLTDVVRQVIPTMSSHFPGVECTDLWEYQPQFTTRAAPTGHFKKKCHLAVRELAIPVSTLGYVDLEGDKTLPHFIVDVQEAERPPLPSEVPVREIHWAETSRKRGIHSASKEQTAFVQQNTPFGTLEDLLQHWRYYQFLLHGPRRLDDPLCDLLGLTQPSDTVKDLMSEPINVWARIVEV